MTAQMSRRQSRRRFLQLCRILRRRKLYAFPALCTRRAPAAETTIKPEHPRPTNQVDGLMIVVKKQGEGADGNAKLRRTPSKWLITLARKDQPKPSPATSRPVRRQWRPTREG